MFHLWLFMLRTNVFVFLKWDASARSLVAKTGVLAFSLPRQGHPPLAVGGTVRISLGSIGEIRARGGQEQPGMTAQCTRGT